MDCGEGNFLRQVRQESPHSTYSYSLPSCSAPSDAAITAQCHPSTSLKRRGHSLTSSWSWTQALLLSCTSLPRKPRNWIRSRRTTQPWSREQCTRLLDQYSTGPVP